MAKTSKQVEEDWSEGGYLESKSERKFGCGILLFTGLLIKLKTH